jgi:hypothetical protein
VRRALRCARHGPANLDGVSHSHGTGPDGPNHTLAMRLQVPNTYIVRQ